MNVWKKAKEIKIELGKECEPGFDVYYDDNVDENTVTQLEIFMDFVEYQYGVPTKLYIDFVNEDSVTSDDGVEQGYIFNWIDWDNYPKFENDDNAPIIKLPVKVGQWEIGDIIVSFIQALTNYYAWLLNKLDSDYELSQEEIDDLINECFEEE